MSKNKIAFLFLIIDNPNFPEIWDYYFKGHEDKYTIYIHPKYPASHTWKPDRIIENLQPTGWGFIVDAYMELFKVAYKDTSNIKFVTISESCVPIKSFDKFYESVIKENPTKSLIKMMKISKYDYEVRLSAQIKKKFKNHLIKHYARMCLQRNHISQLIKSEQNVKIFGKMHVGDEFFLSTITPINNYLDFAVTHDDWDYVEKLKKNIKNEIKLLYEEQENNLKKIDNTNKIKVLKEKYDDIAKNPKTITVLSEEDIENIKKTKSFFYRKFSKESDIKNYIFNFI
jgi:hypothetical protein